MSEQALTEDERELLRLVDAFEDASHANAVGLVEKPAYMAAQAAILAHC